MRTVAQLKTTPQPVYLSPAQVCELLPGLTETVLLRRRKQRLNPPFHKPTGEDGNLVLYDRADVIAWVSESRVQTRGGAA